MRRTFALIATVVLFAGTASAQVTPAAGFTPPDDTQSLRVGMTVFMDNTYTLNPKSTDADGNQFTPSSFNVARSYVNLTGNISHIISYRITPDIANVLAVGAANTSYVFRLKYAYAQFSLDDWITSSRGNWVRLGQQQVPWVDFEEGIYRYRFQGTVFTERNGYLSSSDRGVSFHYTLPSNFGDVHTGIFNGETYTVAETNQQKAWQTRVTIRPFALMDPVLRGLRVSFFYDMDNYVASAERTRIIGSAMFEHQYVNAGFEYLVAKDQTSALSPATAACTAPSLIVSGSCLDKGGKGYSLWLTPKQGANSVGWEALLRYDHLTPDDRSDVINGTVNGVPTTLAFQDQARNRGIIGVAYWFPHPAGGGTAAILFDLDVLATGPGVVGGGGLGPTVTAKALAIHGLLNF